MHELLLERQDAPSVQDLKRYAAELGLDTERFIADLRNQSGTQHIAEDVESADVSSVSGTATFFINGIRHHGAYDIETLTAAVKLAEARSTINR